MKRIAFIRVAAVMLVGGLSLSSCDDITSSGGHSNVEVTNAGAFLLAKVSLTYKGGAIEIANIAAGGKATFKQIPLGPITATGYNSSNNPVASASGTLTSSIALLTLDW